MEREEPGKQMVQAADPGLRRKFPAFLLVVLAFGSAAVLLTSRLFDPETSLQDPRSLAEKFEWAAWLGTLFWAVVTGWVFLMARRIHRDRRYPPPQMRVLRDTPVVTGRAALVRAWVGYTLSLLCAGLGLAHLLLLLEVRDQVLRLAITG